MQLFENLFMLNFILQHVAKQDLSPKEFTEEKVENKKLTDAVKDNYSKRIEEVDHFSRRLMNACCDLNTECLYGSLNIAQHFIDMQGNKSREFPALYPTDLMLNLIKRNTQAWSQAVQNMDSIYIEGTKNIKNNVRAMNKNSILFIQTLERIYSLYNKFPSVKEEKQN